MTARVHLPSGIEQTRSLKAGSTATADSEVPLRLGLRSPALEELVSNTDEINMTTPMERARALRFAHEVLTLACKRKDVPEDLRRQAYVTLRHLPTPQDIAFLAQQPVLNWWIEPEQSRDLSAGRTFDMMPLPETYRAQTSVWTAWLEHAGDNDMLSSFATVGYATDEQLARAMFAGRFGLEFARLAYVANGILANDVTERVIARESFERMAFAAHRHDDFCVYARLDHQVAPSADDSTEPGTATD